MHALWACLSRGCRTAFKKLQSEGYTGRKLATRARETKDKCVIRGVTVLRILGPRTGVGRLRVDGRYSCGSGTKVVRLRKGFAPVGDGSPRKQGALQTAVQ